MLILSLENIQLVGSYSKTRLLYEALLKNHPTADIPPDIEHVISQ